jgi:DNA polymerase III subunit delta'
MSNIAWPNELKGCDAARSLETALAAGRLGHGMIFVCDEIAQADVAAVAIGGAILQGAMPHADYLKVEPQNKQRQIGVEPMRELREFLQKSSLSGKKVAHISQADRLNGSAANLFLKVLEEPPAGSYIIMTTDEPYAVLPTLVSRAMRFRFPAATGATHAQLAAWQEELRAFLNDESKQGVLAGYPLMDKALNLLTQMEDEKMEAPEDADPEVVEAMEVARQKAFRKEIFAALENAVLQAYKDNPKEGLYLGEALRKIEKVYRLLEMNLNTAAALESAISSTIAALKPTPAARG